MPHRPSHTDASPSDNPDARQSPQASFLQHLSQSGNVSAAARAAGRSRQYFYRCHRRNPAFAAAWAHAVEEAADRLELEAVRRAVDGVETEQFYQGQVIGVVRRYSDALLMFLLKARRPDRFASGGGDGAGDAPDNLAEVRREIEEQLDAASTVDHTAKGA